MKNHKLNFNATNEQYIMLKALSIATKHNMTEIILAGIRQQYESADEKTRKDVDTVIRLLFSK